MPDIMMFWLTLAVCSRLMPQPMEMLCTHCNPWLTVQGV